MKNISVKQFNFQKFYASRFVTLVFFVVSIELFILVMVIFGGAR